PTPPPTFTLSPVTVHRGCMSAYFHGSDRATGPVPRPVRPGSDLMPAGNRAAQHSTDRGVGPHSDRHHGQSRDPVVPVFDVRGLSVFYGDNKAVRDVDLKVGPRRITAMIGPSGCGKSTVLRTLSRMNDLITGARVEGRVSYNGEDLY